jgi:hypothetical protein
MALSFLQTYAGTEERFAPDRFEGRPLLCGPAGCSGPGHKRTPDYLGFPIGADRREGKSLLEPLEGDWP